jgi:uncharacterized protein (DUF608 family)
MLPVEGIKSLDMNSGNQHSPRRGQRVFENESLRTVAFPLGGIGTGTVSLGGRGQLRDWEIFNHPAKGTVLPFTFFSLWCRPEGGDAVARLLERQMLPPFDEGGGIPPARMAGLPRFRDAKFHGEYPFAWLDLSDPAVPVAATLRAWNPMIPLEADDSGIPVALFDWRITNPTDRPVEISLALNMLNPVGWDGHAPLGGRKAPFFGGNVNEERQANGLSGIRMFNERIAGDDPRHGTAAIGTTWEDVGICRAWERGAWFDDLQSFWDDFRDDGRVTGEPAPGPTPDGETDVASVCAFARLEPGAAVEIPFTLAWSFPNLRNQWDPQERVRGAALGNRYAARFPDAWTAAAHVAENRARLEAETAAFHDALFDSTLPDEVLDAVSANMSIVRSTTCIRTADGRLNAFEGCSDTIGCCPMNCTHVWNYAQAMAWLYPALERTVRDTDFQANTTPEGDMAFRTLLPLIGERWKHHPAADGQMGTILRLYREWKMSGDTDWLRGLWPAAKAALEFAWSPANPDGWDRDRDGVMEGIQHNTYDIEFAGPNVMMGAWYLGALRAASKMARALGEDDKADEYTALAERGAEGHDALWNGEYYVQNVRFDPRTQSNLLTPQNGKPPVDDGFPRYQYGAGCLSDQLVGQWFAHCVGLGHVLPAAKVQSTIAAIGKYNFQRDLSAHESCQRTYALNDEAGLLLCSWPSGGRPKFPFPYADEVWTGIEYQVAAHMIFEGLVEEGLEIVRAVRDRHDGARRNPWDEFECGHHYARAMASWSLLIALSGVAYSAPDASIGFAPRADGDFRCLFITGTAWGVYARAGETQTLSVLHGSLTLRRWRNAVGSATLDGIDIRSAPSGGGLDFLPDCVLAPGQTLQATVVAPSLAA